MTFILAQATDADFQLMPDAAELVWGVVVLMLLVGLLAAAVFGSRNVMRSRRDHDTRLRRVEERLDELERR